MTRQQAMDMRTVVQEIDGAIQGFALGLAMARESLPNVLRYCEQLREAGLDDNGIHLIWLIELYATRNLEALSPRRNTSETDVEAGSELELMKLVWGLHTYLLASHWDPSQSAQDCGADGPRGTVRQESA